MENRQMAGEESEKVVEQRSVSSWPFQTACMHYIGATTPDCIPHAL